jgi:hypothetical protein
MRVQSISLVTLFALALVPARAFAADPIGPENCKVCHQAAYQAWAQSGHAESTASLSPRQKKDRRCMSCHAPDAAKGVSEVSCESCHGGGQYYSPRYVMKDAELARAVGLSDPTETTGRRCHDANAPSIKPFDFAEKLKQIDHWTAERKARNPEPKSPPPAPKKKK